MKSGYLSEYFEGVACKRLSMVEADSSVSNQHEFNGVSQLKLILGETSEKRKYSSKYIYIGEDDTNISCEGTVTWYDARLNTPDRTEYRFYYTSNEVTDRMKENDLLFVAKKSKEDYIYIIIIQSGISAESQVLWLMGIDYVSTRFSVEQIDGSNDKIIDFSVRYILSELGISLKPTNSDIDVFESIYERFNKNFPKTTILSSLVQSTFITEDLVDNPDDALLSLISKEEELFKFLEKKYISQTIVNGFMSNGEADVDSFINFSLSVQNRRKSRAGAGFENHIEYILKANNIQFDRNPQTENRSKPDFIFPGIKQYKNPSFSIDKLTVLAAKSTCKDRWRQVLSEAKRISTKHLITLEPSISVNQTNEMSANDVRLVLPDRIIHTYKKEQRSQVVSFKEFISSVRLKQDY